MDLTNEIDYRLHGLVSNFQQVKYHHLEDNYGLGYCIWCLLQLTLLIKKREVNEASHWVGWWQQEWKEVMDV